MISPKEMVPQLTRDCAREDCGVLCLGAHSTLGSVNMGTVYDKHGFVVPSRPDPVTVSYFCRTCGQKWAVTDGKIEVTKEAA
jgi:hypothetical protein